MMIRIMLKNVTTVTAISNTRANIMAFIEDFIIYGMVILALYIIRIATTLNSLVDISYDV